MTHTYTQNGIGLYVISPDDLNGTANPTAYPINQNFKLLKTVAVTGNYSDLSGAPSLTGYVPYTGANATVDLNTQELKCGELNVGNGSGTYALSVGPSGTYTATSLDNGAITTDGAGDITLISISSSGTTSLDSGGITTDGSGDILVSGAGNSAYATPLGNPSLIVTGMFSLDNGNMISDGTGDLVVNANGSGGNLNAAGGSGSGYALVVKASGTSLDGGNITTDGSGDLSLPSGTMLAKVIQAIDATSQHGFACAYDTGTSMPAIQATHLGVTNNISMWIQGAGGNLLVGVPGSSPYDDGTHKLQVYGSTAFYGALTVSAQNITTDTSTGMKIGTATSQKLGFFNATPVAQPASPSGNTTTGSAGSTTAAYLNTTYKGASGSTAYTIGDIVTALKALGLLAS